MTERLFVRLHDDPVHGPESDVPSRSLHRLAVPGTHRSWVSHALAYDEQMQPAHGVVERVLPDGAARLIYVDRVDADGGSPTLVLAGPTLSPALVRQQGHVRGVSITLMPGAALALFGLPARHLVDRTVPLRDLWPRFATDLAGHLADQSDLRLAAHVLFDAIGRNAGSRSFDAARLATRAVQIMQAGPGMETPRVIAHALGLGERRLQQIFNDHVGLAPKAVSRLTRFQGLLRALRRDPSPGWAELAPNFGFYDQAHLTNEFRAMTGLSPGQFLARTGAQYSKTARN